MRPAWLEVDRAAVLHNLRVTRSLLSERVGIIAIVKGNCYGHGLVEVAPRVAAAPGVSMLGVALVEEAMSLREAGVTTPILVLGASATDAAEMFVARDVTATIVEPGFAEVLAGAARRAGRRAKAHVKIDSGMGRQGCRWGEAEGLFAALAGMPELDIEGVFTHFALTEDKEFAAQQLSCFLEGVKRGEAALGRPIRIKHAAASAGILRMPEAHLDAVRPGIILFGGRSGVAEAADLDLRPTITLKARVLYLKTIEPGASVGYNRAWLAQRPTRIALLPLGYGDGYTRALSGKAGVLVRGRRAPVVGLISMDCVTIDVTDVPEVAIGDEAVLIGEQDEERITVEDIAMQAGTVQQEILSRLAPRLPRVYVS